jgi:hypothetical protein
VRVHARQRHHRALVPVAEEHRHLLLNACAGAGGDAVCVGGGASVLCVIGRHLRTRSRERLPVASHASVPSMMSKSKLLYASRHSAFINSVRPSGPSGPPAPPTRRAATVVITPPSSYEFGHPPLFIPGTPCRVRRSLLRHRRRQRPTPSSQARGAESHFFTSGGWFIHTTPQYRARVRNGEARIRSRSTFTY